jgi:hypothetical protein
MEPYLTHAGVSVYRVYKEEEGVPRTFHFSLDDDGREFGDRVFDVRELPTYAGRQETAAYPSYPYATRGEADAIRGAIVGALEAGLRLDDWTHEALRLARARP